MATLLLQAAGGFAGNLIGGAFGAIIGQAVGSVAGALVDQALFGTQPRNSFGPRLNRLPGLSASEGVPIVRVFGRARVGGTLIWMTRFEEVATTTRAGRSGGKGSSPKTTNYSYFGNFAVGVCEGPIAQIRRIWADGEEIDQTQFTIRVYNGGEDQGADPLIVAKEGAANAPAYKGLAYVVFERMPLEDFGNRVPQFSFEVVRLLPGQNDHIRAVCVIPGSSEFAYEPRSVIGAKSSGVSSSENRHVLTHESDWAASMDALQALCPNLERVALIVSWFGDDLRAGQCSVTPRSEKADKALIGFNWSVAGLNRMTATAVTNHAGKPAYGGTPSDESVIAAIVDLKARGLEVVFYPFVMMDIPQTNGLEDPWTGNAAQPAYPWRGRITCDPAPGRAGSPDGTAAAQAQLDSFFGSASPSSSEWSYRRFILHYASLCERAGGVNGFLVGSELRSLTRVRSAPGVYPAVTALASLAADVKAILGPGTQVSYAADWTEYGAHVLDDAQEVRFPLDPLWASPAIDFVGIDAYWPLSDWRDGEDHIDRSSARSIYDLDYLRANMAAGEGFDWHYPDEAARQNQSRAPISDGAYGKPWMFRVKDVRNWWLNHHFEREGGVELAAPTAWTPGAKPIRFMEMGCPAVDRGANAPNVFPDAKSSESRLPWHSRGHRDDLIQLRTIEAFISHFDPDDSHYYADANPISSAYGGRMVDLAQIYLWAWDARPFPAFPQQSDVWADANAWNTGHWLNGRLEAVCVDRLVAELAGASGLGAVFDARPRIDGIADGYVLDAPVSPRAAIEPLATFFGFDMIASSGRVTFFHTSEAEAWTLSPADLVAMRDGAQFELRRNQESELPRQIGFNFYDGETDYRPAAAAARLAQSGSLREKNFDLPLVTTRAEAQRRAEMALNDIWTNREELSIFLPPSALFLEVGDVVGLTLDGANRRFKITRIVDSRVREISARAHVTSFRDHPPPIFPPARVAPPAIAGPARVDVLDLAIARDTPAVLQYLAVFADPWPGRMAIWRSIGGSAYALIKIVEQAAIVGESLTDFMPGVTARFDRRNELVVKLSGGALSSVDEAAGLAGRNALAIRGADQGWEICAFLDAELIGERTWRLSKFLRGLGGAEFRASFVAPAGSTVVALDEAIIPLTSDLTDIGKRHRYRIGPLNRHHSDATYVEIETTASFAALTPYAPVRARARRTLAGVEFTFLRRGRIDSDSWELVNIPLGEDVEQYEIDIFAGAAVVRTLQGNSSTILYVEADEMADFGAIQSQLDVAIRQISVVAGRGFPLRALVPVE